MSDSGDYNLNFFTKKELKQRNNIDYIIVINGYIYNKEIEFPDLDNLTIIKRENIGYDFGGYNSALEYIESNNKTYDYYFFLNSGVIGPILPNYFTQPHWSNIFIRKINDRVKLVGTTIVCLPHWDKGGFGPKVEGFFFVVDNIGLNILKNEKTIFHDHKDKEATILNGEYGMSKAIFNAGYTIDCMLPKYQNVDWTNPENHNMNNNLHPSRKNMYFGGSINPYDVIFHKWFWHGLEPVNFDIIQQYVNSNLDKPS